MLIKAIDTKTGKEKLVASSGFANDQNNVIYAALVERIFGGKKPRTMEDYVKLGKSLVIEKLPSENINFLIGFTEVVLRDEYSNRKPLLRLNNEIKSAIFLTMPQLARSATEEDIAIMERLNEIYWRLLLEEAKGKQVDSYFLYLEKNRDPKDKFYQPCRKQFRKFGLTQALQGMIDDEYDYLCISMPPSSRKAQPMYSNVLTPNGFVRMGDVKVGTKVIAGNGNVANVVGVYPQGIKPIYEITLSNGSKCRCSDEHLWDIQIKRRSTNELFGGIVTMNDILLFAKDPDVDVLVPIYHGASRYISNVRYVGDEDCQCILIDDPTHLYITDDYVITHNTTAEKFFLSGVIGWYPKDYNLFYSHSSDITRMFYDSCYQIATDTHTYTWRDIFPELKVTSTNAKMQQFNIGEYKPFPSLQTASIGSEMAGKVRASKFLMVDDMIGKLEEALNKNILDKLWNAYAVDARQRKDKGKDGGLCKEIHIATRWSIHDPIGRLQRLYENDPRFKVIAVPATYTDEKGETQSNFMYDYGGFTVEDFMEQQKVMDDISYRCLYMQQPVEREGLLYHEDEMRTYVSLPLCEPDTVLGICDTKNTGTDFMFLPCLLKYGEDYYCVDCHCNDTTDFDIQYREMTNLITSNGVVSLEIESNQGGKAIGTTLMEKIRDAGWDCNITLHPTESNKVARIIANSYWVKQHVIFRDKSLYTPKSPYGVMMSQLFTWSQTGKNPHDDIPDGFANLADYVQNRLFKHVRKSQIRKSPI